MRTVVMLAFPGAQVLDLAGPAAVFTEAAVFAQPAPYRVIVASAKGGPVATGAGLAMLTEPLGDLPGTEIDTVMIPGADVAPLAQALDDKGLREAAAPLVARAQRLASVCTGAYLLAAWGLLDGRRAATHWAAAADLQARFPKIAVQPNALFIEDGPVWTSAGVSTGIDLSLALVERDLGTKLAGDVARRLVLQMRRPGHQSQFSAVLSAQRGPYSDLATWIGDNLTADLSLESLASRCGQAPRTFHRRFTRSLGRTPAAFVEDIRLARARALLEAGRSPKEVARLVGVGSMDRLGRAFGRAFGLSPSAYRLLHGAAAAGVRAQDWAG